MGQSRSFFEDAPMAKNSSDQFSKQFLEEFLTPYGSVEISHEVLGESQLVDVYFTPNPHPETQPASLGLLRRLAQTPCLIEPFRSPPSVMEVRSCLSKLFQVHSHFQRQAKRQSQSLKENDLPQLWILASAVSKKLLKGFGAVVATGWPRGVYFLPTHYKTGMISINQLPVNSDTLWLRLLGKGKTQQQAISEVMALEMNNPSRSTILRLLANWKISLEVTAEFEAEQELLMALSQAYLEWEQLTVQRGRQEGLERERSLIFRLLTRKLGSLPETVRSQVEAFSLEQLEAVGEALLDFQAIADLETWLDENQ
jgi:hypothetical protein